MKVQTNFCGISRHSLCKFFVSRTLLLSLCLWACSSVAEVHAQTVPGSNNVPIVQILIGMAEDIEIHQVMVDGHRYSSSQAILDTALAGRNQFKDWGVKVRRQHNISTDQVSGALALDGILRLDSSVDEFQLRRVLRKIRSLTLKEYSPLEAVQASLEQYQLFGGPATMADAIAATSASGFSIGLLWSTYCPDANCAPLAEQIRYVKQPVGSRVGLNFWKNNITRIKQLKRDERKQRQEIKRLFDEAKRTAKAAEHRAGVAMRTTGSVQAENLRKARSAAAQAQRAAAAAQQALKKLRQANATNAQIIKNETRAILNDQPVVNWTRANSRWDGHKGIRVKGTRVESAQARLESSQTRSNRARSLRPRNRAPVFGQLGNRNRMMQRNASQETSGDDVVQSAINVGGVGDVAQGAHDGWDAGKGPAKGLLGLLGGLAATVENGREYDAFVDAANNFLESKNSPARFGNYKDTQISDDPSTSFDDRLANAERTATDTALAELQALADKYNSDIDVDGVPYNGNVPDDRIQGVLEKHAFAAMNEKARLTARENQLNPNKLTATHMMVDMENKVAQAQRQAERAREEAAAAEEQNKAATSDDGFPNADGSDSGTGGNASSGSSGGNGGGGQGSSNDDSDVHNGDPDDNNTGNDRDHDYNEGDANEGDGTSCEGCE